MTLLKVYTTYRFVLSLILLLSFVLATKPLVGGLKPVLFIYASVIYLAINSLSLALILRLSSPLDQQKLFVHFTIDIVALVAIADSTGGITSGAAILLIVVVAASSIMLSSRIATLTAAIASLAILTDTLRLMTQDHLPAASLLPAGLLGMVMFATSFVIQNLASRIRQSQSLAEQRAADVYKLEGLNQQIVQSMNTGIIVADSARRIRIANQASAERLGVSVTDAHENPQLAELLPTQLLAQLQLWQARPDQHTPPFQMSSTGPELQASFSMLQDSGETLIFIDDNRALAQRAQQIKLASLGRLTASIAHEIRNPLGAISHAAQLLKESPSLDKADRRLSEIIQNHCQRMNQIVENVLQLSRRSNAKPERINLVDCLKRFADEYSSATPQAADIKLITESDEIIVNIDSSQFQQVLSNLVENGLRYSQQHTGTATLTLLISRDKHNQLPVLDIIDDGVGIAENNRENIFEPFFTTEASGTGLGLFIAKEMCEANQARLNYLINDTGKSCFRISFAHPERRIVVGNGLSDTEPKQTND